LISEVIVMLAALDELQVFGVWIGSLLAAVVAIVLVVLLIHAITRNALAIDESTDRIIASALRILDSTDALAAVGTTAQVSEDLLRTVAAVDSNVTAILTVAAAGAADGRR
jgi:hypothetical protein